MWDSHIITWIGSVRYDTTKRTSTKHFYHIGKLMTLRPLWVAPTFQPDVSQSMKFWKYFPPKWQKKTHTFPFILEKWIVEICKYESQSLSDFFLTNFLTGHDFFVPFNRGVLYFWYVFFTVSLMVLVHVVKKGKKSQRNPLDRYGHTPILYAPQLDYSGTNFLLKPKSIRAISKICS